MIVQRRSNGADARFIIRNMDHAIGAGALAAAFGNDRFPGLDGVIQWAVEHHEDGWAAVDDAPELDPGTGLPYATPETPNRLRILKSRLAADNAERHHPLAGLVVSMHVTGLYEGRYGVSDKHQVLHVPDEDGLAVDTMLAYERSRRERLASVLASSTRDAIGLAYRQLTFFDTLALHVQDGDEALWENDHYPSVPSVDGDLVVAVRPLGDRHLAVDPWPFKADAVVVETPGRYLEPQASEAELRRALEAAPVTRQSATFVPG